MLPNNESMGKFCLEIGSTYLLATRTAPSATFKQQLQTTNNMYTTTHKIIVFQSSTSRSLKVYEDATKKFLKFVLQIPRLAAAAAALLDTEQTFPWRFFQEKHWEISVRGVPVCVQSSEQQQMGTWGYIVGQEKGGKKQKKPMTASWLHFIFYLIYLILFLGENFVNLYPPNTLYIHYCSEFSKKKIFLTYFLQNLNLKKGKRKKKRGSTIVVHKGGFSTCLLTK